MLRWRVCALVMPWLACAAAEAVPALQVYSPGSVYDFNTKTWGVGSVSPFTVQVLGATDGGLVQSITDVSIEIALRGDPAEQDLVVTGPRYESGLKLDTWVPGSIPGPNGGVFGYSCTLSLPDMHVAAGPAVIPDIYPLANGEDTGVIYEYTFNYNAVGDLQFSASGTASLMDGGSTVISSPSDDRVEFCEPAAGPYHPIYGTVWDDTNGNGVADEGESPTMNEIVRLLDTSGNCLCETRTSSNGFYMFDPFNGEYAVCDVLPEGWVHTVPLCGFYALTIDCPGPGIGCDFGRQLAIDPPGSASEAHGLWCAIAGTLAACRRLHRRRR